MSVLSFVDVKIFCQYIKCVEDGKKTSIFYVGLGWHAGNSAAWAINGIFNGHTFCYLPRGYFIIGDTLLDEALARQGIERIAPHRKNRKKPAPQDGRNLHRYKRRWQIKHLFAWRNKFKKAIIRWDWRCEWFTALVPLVFSMIPLKKVVKISYQWWNKF